MSNPPRHSTASNEDISELADACAVMAVQSVLEPDDDQVPAATALMLRELCRTRAGRSRRRLRLRNPPSDPGTGETYYRCWLAALPRVAVAKARTNRGELERRPGRGDGAALGMRQGQSIKLANDSHLPPLSSRNR
jgi:hypothetical protein